jgi:hypothetical protein
MEKKLNKGRKPLPDNQRGVITSIRLTPTRLSKFKELGSAKWLSRVLDDNIEMDKDRQLPHQD